MEHFHTSKAFDIDTFGISGLVSINRKDDDDIKVQKKQEKKSKYK